MDRVAFAGHLEMLKYLEFIGCEFTNLGGRVKSPVAPLLAFMKNRDVFKYLYTKTKLDSTQREWVLFSAQEKGYKDLVQLIKKQA